MVDLGDVVMILDLHRQGLSVSAIARAVGIDRKTVRKYIARGLEPPVYGPRQPRLIDGASDRLRQHAELLPEHIRSKAVIAPPTVPPPRRRGRPPKMAKLAAQMGLGRPLMDRRAVWD